MSLLLLESRVVMMRVRHSKVGRKDVNSLISRQHIANPRPLNCPAFQHLDFEVLVAIVYLLAPVTST